jgi:hypothetical protein
MYRFLFVTVPIGTFIVFMMYCLGFFPETFVWEEFNNAFWNPQWMMPVSELELKTLSEIWGYSIFALVAISGFASSLVWFVTWGLPHGGPGGEFKKLPNFFEFFFGK